MVIIRLINFYVVGRTMKNRNSKSRITLVVLCLILCNSGVAAVPSRIEITTKRAVIKVGEPLTYKVTYAFEEPLILESTNKAVEFIEPYAHLQVHKSDNNRLVVRHPIMPQVVLRGGGSEYSGNFLVFYDHDQGKLIFDKPGSYILQVDGWTKTSNALSIEVQPASESGKRAISLLSDPNDYHFLVFASHEYAHKRPERMSHLIDVVEQCEGTFLGKWCAARLGLEYFKDFHEKNPSFEEFKAKYYQGKVTEPVFEKAYQYLTKGVNLPDEIAIRENVLYWIVRMETIRGDYQKALTYVREMGEKYPQGKYGRRAPRIERQISESQSCELEESQQDRGDQAERSEVLSVVVPVAAGIFVVALVLILLLKKKASSSKK